MAPPVLLDTCALYMMNQNGWLPDDYVFDREEANADAAVAEFDALLRQTTPRLKGAPYVFDRADAYEPETPANSPTPTKPSIPS
ncbi:MAG: hypothetical protein IKO01_12615 [Kiritimatiellae bacterium]|nr:hypothetical protein [Kiritimatiellia bacterium]